MPPNLSVNSSIIVVPALMVVSYLLLHATKANLPKNPCIDDLPEEILGYIFDLTIDRTSSYPDSQGQSYCYLTPNQSCNTQSPRNISLVCKYWRHVVLREVSIWTHLSSNVNDGISPPSLRAMGYWISLSQGAPLRLSLRQSWTTRNTTKAHAASVLQLYASHARRIRSLELHVEQIVIRKFNQTLLNTRFPILDDLQIHMHPHVPMEDFDALCSAIHALRSLRHLTLRQSDPWNRFAQEAASMLPWERLETLQISTAISLADARQVLKSCVSATTIRLHGIEPTYAANHSDAPPGITLSEADCRAKGDLPRLTNLTLEGWNCPTALLQAFSLPNLETLLIISSQPCLLEYKPLSDILHAQNRFSPKLKSVTLQNHYRIFSGDVFCFVRGTRALSLVPDVSIAYSRISLPQLYELDHLIDAQVTIDENGVPDTQTNPPPARLMIWDDNNSPSGSPGPMNINIGWSYSMGGLKYSPLALWDEEGILMPLGDLGEVFQSVAISHTTCGNASAQAYEEYWAQGRGDEFRDELETEINSDEDNDS